MKQHQKPMFVSFDVCRFDHKAFTSNFLAREIHPFFPIDCDFYRERRRLPYPQWFSPSDIREIFSPHILLYILLYSSAYTRLDQLISPSFHACPYLPAVNRSLLHPYFYPGRVNVSKCIILNRHYTNLIINDLKSL